MSATYELVDDHEHSNYRDTDYKCQAYSEPGVFRLEFTWQDKRPVKAERLIVDENKKITGPYIMLVAYDCVGIVVLHSHYIPEIAFDDASGTTAEIVDIVDGVRSSYYVPMTRIQG
jgi:hypothetical protein